MPLFSGCEESGNAENISNPFFNDGTNKCELAQLIYALFHRQLLYAAHHPGQKWHLNNEL